MVADFLPLFNKSLANALLSSNASSKPIALLKSPNPALLKAFEIPWRVFPVKPVALAISRSASNLFLASITNFSENFKLS